MKSCCHHLLKRKCGWLGPFQRPKSDSIISSEHKYYPEEKEDIFTLREAELPCVATESPGEENISKNPSPVLTEWSKEETRIGTVAQLQLLIEFQTHDNRTATEEGTTEGQLAEGTNSEAAPSQT